MIKRVGFIGLGAMGRPMALNILRGGFGLSVYARRPEAAEPLLKAGAGWCRTPAQLAGETDIFITMITSTADVERVTFGVDGLIEGAKPGSVLVDMSTISPAKTRDIARRLAEKGVEMLDAPVSGGEIGAKEATLSIMVGGDDDTLARVMPVLSCLGKNIVRVGPSGAGQVTKACNQLVLLVAIQALAEAFTFARASGVDLGKLSEALSGGMAGSRILEVLGKRMIERQYQNGIEARLHYKDIQLVLEEAANLGLALPGAALVTQLFNALIGRGKGREDSSQLIEIVEGISFARSG